MSLSPGEKLGPYEILSPIGAGGMGEVYKARDTRLGRLVAIKTSREQFSERFELEARAVAALNHSHICQLYDVGPSYLVMEYIEGTPLKGPLPLDQALKYAAQICDALDAAHKKGITHRDLKPANILLTRSGVKLLDFGLAKLGHSTQSPDGATFAMSLTGKNEIVSTLYYMSPEQLQPQAGGRELDARSDIFSFGIVLYEMLTGKRAFAGSSPASVIAAIIERPAPSIADVAPIALDWVLKKCLAKDPDERWQSARDLKDELQWLAGASGDAVAVPASGQSRFSWAWVAAGVLGIVALVSSVWAIRATSTATGASRLGFANLVMDLAPAEMLGPARSIANNRPSRTSFTISPDGATVIFAGTVDGKSMLYRRPLAEATTTAIAGTEGAEYPFFSPDGQWVGFTAQAGPDYKLKKVAMGGGPPIDLCALNSRGSGASWGSSGVIVFADRGFLRTVPDSGGTPATVLERSRVSSPAMLPDGQTVVFTEVSSSNWEDAHVDFIHISTKQRKTLVTNAADARYSPTGHLVFMRNAALLAVAFDAARGEISGSPIPLVAGIMQAVNAGNGGEETGMGQFAISASGTLLYASGGIHPTPASSLVRVDRNGKETKLADIQGALFGLRLSPDGSRVVAFKTNDGSAARDLWSLELTSGSATRLTSNRESMWPLFSPDGKSIIYSQSGKNAGLYSLATDGSRTPSLIQKGGPALTAASWSPDGRWLAYVDLGGNVHQLFVRLMEPPGEGKAFAASTFYTADAQFSPDGRWIAYSSVESGTNEVYVQAFPGPGAKHRISLNGGGNPAWSRNGQELFYLPLRQGSNALAMTAVEISRQDGSRVGAPHVLFEGPYAYTMPLRSYDVTADGHFVMVRWGERVDQRVTKLNVVLGWAEELKRRVPSKTPAR